MDPEPAASPSEFRRYRRGLAWFILAFVSLGSVYLLVSVGVTIYRRRNAVPVGDPVGRVATVADLQSCFEELVDVQQGMERHLDNFHTLVAHYDAEEAQRWAEDQSFWLGQWRAAGERCQFSRPRAGPHSKEWEELGVIHTELRDTEDSYTKELTGFAKRQTPRLDRLRKRMEQLGARLNAATSEDPTPDRTADLRTPTTTTDRDSGAIP